MNNSPAKGYKIKTGWNDHRYLWTWTIFRNGEIEQHSTHVDGLPHLNEGDAFYDAVETMISLVGSTDGMEEPDRWQWEKPTDEKGFRFATEEDSGVDAWELSSGQWLWRWRVRHETAASGEEPTKTKALIKGHLAALNGLGVPGTSDGGSGHVNRFDAPKHAISYKVFNDRFQMWTWEMRVPGLTLSAGRRFGRKDDAEDDVYRSICRWCVDQMQIDRVDTKCRSCNFLHGKPRGWACWTRLCLMCLTWRKVVHRVRTWIGRYDLGRRRQVKKMAHGFGFGFGAGAALSLALLGGVSFTLVFGL